MKSEDILELSRNLTVAARLTTSFTGVDDKAVEDIQEKLVKLCIGEFLKQHISGNAAPILKQKSTAATAPKASGTPANDRVSERNDDGAAEAVCDENEVLLRADAAPYRAPIPKPLITPPIAAEKEEKEVSPLIDESDREFLRELAKKIAENAPKRDGKLWDEILTEDVFKRAYKATGYNAAELTRLTGISYSTVNRGIKRYCRK